MDQGLLRHRDIQQGIALRGLFADTRPHGQQQISLPQPGDHAGISADTDFANIIVVMIIETVLIAEGATDGQAVGFGKSCDIGHRLWRPGAAAQHHDRPRCRRQQDAKLGHVVRAGVGLDRTITSRVADAGQFSQHILRQGHYNWAGAARRRHMKGLADQFGNTGRIHNFHRPFANLAKETAEIHFLERLPLHHRATHLADEQNQRRTILKGGMQTHDGVTGAWATGDEANPRSARQLAIGLRHVGRVGFMPAGQQPYFRGVVQSI